uniref:Acyl-coenzyme A thioesterase THEM4 n=2 Tax=Xenopus tropicalis TaxID=8364 RepID=A0A1B8XYI8_XENTR
MGKESSPKSTEVHEDQSSVPGTQDAGLSRNRRSGDALPGVTRGALSCDVGSCRLRGVELWWAGLQGTWSDVVTSLSYSAGTGAGATMLRSCARLIRRGIALPGQPQSPRPLPCCYTTPRFYSPEVIRDYAMPNATWSKNLQDLYNRYMEGSQSGAWERIPSYNATVHHIKGVPPSRTRENRLFTRNLDQDGVGFEYSMFYNKAERRMVCLFQPGPYLEGPPGFTHGGCIATIIDSTTGAGAVYLCGSVMTANLTINYKNPIPLGHVVIIDSKVERVEGRKVYTSCQIRSHDDAVLHTEASALFIKLGP